MKHPKYLLAAALLLAASAVTPAAGQGGRQDEQSLFLEVRQRQVELRSAKAELDRARHLMTDGLVSQAEIDRKETLYESAQLKYQVAVLSLVNQTPRITVQQAVKFQDEDGRKLVRLVLANRTPTFDDSQYRMLNDFEGAAPIPEELRTRDLKDVYVSLLDAGGGGEAGTAIGLPYEYHIEHLPYGETEILIFQLLRDVNSVDVATSYKGQPRNVRIQLEQEETENLVEVTSMQISQEVDLGAEAIFDLRLNRSSVDVQRFQLQVLSLPPQITYSFQRSGSEARLSQLSFPAGVTEQDLRLRLFMPERIGGEIALDRPLEFLIAVSDGGLTSEAADGTLTAKELEESRAGIARLQIIPRGVGKIDVIAPSLFGEIEQGQTFETQVTVKNSGTRRLDNVMTALEMPLDWQGEVEPKLLPALGSGEERRVTLRATPSSNAPIGEYEVRLKTESLSAGRAILSQEKTFRVRVKSEGNLIGVVLLLVTLSTVLIGAATFWVRLNRR